jgi:hypothetical protein
MARPTVPMVLRLMARVKESPSGCWLWTGKTDEFGYGRMKVGRQLARAHRVAYEIFVGPIPLGECVLHSCDTPNCVFPGHLRAGTHGMNVGDKVDRDRQAKGSDHPESKLRESDAAAILCDARTQREIAADYGVSHTVIGRIKRRQDWKHVAPQDKLLSGRRSPAPRPTS